MKKILFFALIVMLLGCSTKREATIQTDYSKIISELREFTARTEKRLEIYRDSLGIMKGLVEKSTNITDSTSHLETSYAKSDALFKAGRLYHSLENKDSIPVIIKYINIISEKYDTVFIERVDTIYKDKEVIKETVIEKKRFWGGFFYTSGWLAWLMVVVGSGIWFRYKIKKGEK